ncbi:MAG TPA: ABC transporter permease [Steroidobacteraceae bacterium]|jgi:putative ABC transport system permease protein|nr:ABC transporter permease [Steroidobacteraceae bacterium]
MLRQTIAVTGINVKSIPERWAPSLVIVIGLAGVVAVFTALLAMATGFESTLRSTGRADVGVVMRGGSETELNSGLDRESTDLIKQAKGVRIGANGRPVASGEMTIIAELLRAGSLKDASNITLRGVDPEAFALRPQLKIVEGRNFTPGLRELIVGRGVTRQFAGAGLGKAVRMRGSDWAVVGIFESGDANESELWTDINVARTTFGRTGSNSVRVALDGPDGFDKVKASLTGDPRLTVDVVREVDYFSGQTKQFRKTIGVLAGVVTIIMALGAVFAALNSMYAAVATRSKEIATLRAIGFGGLPVLLSVMIEALLLALAGGLLGAMIAYVLFNNLSVSTLGQNFTQVVFNFKVTPELVTRGLIISIVIGMIGGLLPAIRAARLPVTTGLREL